MSTDWYAIDADRQQRGPYTRDALILLVTNGKISPSAPVWSDGMADWKPFNTVFPRADPAPPPPSVSVSTPVSTPVDKIWYLMGADRQQRGPYTRKELDALLTAEEKLSDDILVWSAGRETWLPFKKVFKKIPAWPFIVIGIIIYFNVLINSKNSEVPKVPADPMENCLEYWEDNKPRIENGVVIVNYTVGSSHSFDSLLSVVMEKAWDFGQKCPNLSKARINLTLPNIVRRDGTKVKDAVQSLEFTLAGTRDYEYASSYSHSDFIRPIYMRELKSGEIGEVQLW